MPTLDQIKDVYSLKFTNIGNKLPHVGSGYQLMLIKKFIPNNKNINVLDAGCGNGAYAINLLDEGYKSIVAVDLFNEISVKGVAYQKSSIDNMPFESNTFDFIYSLSVIYYLPSVENALNELYRVCKPGSYIVITGHTKYSLFSFWRIFLRKFFNKRFDHLNGAKFNTCNSYINLANKAGFRLVFRDGFTLSFILYPLYKIFVKHFFRLTKINLPLFNKHYYLSKNKLIRNIKSEIAYHFAIVFQKPTK